MRDTPISSPSVSEGVVNIEIILESLVCMYLYTASEGVVDLRDHIRMESRLVCMYLYTAYGGAVLTF